MDCSGNDWMTAKHSTGVSLYTFPLLRLGALKPLRLCGRRAKRLRFVFSANSHIQMLFFVRLADHDHGC